MILVAFYNKKALGVRYLEAALEGVGYQVTTIFYKDFNSVRPAPLPGGRQRCSSRWCGKNSRCLWDCR